jgi:hypothetical protein
MREAASGDETDALVRARCIVSDVCGVLKRVKRIGDRRSSGGYHSRLGEVWVRKLRREWRKKKSGVDARDRAEKNSPRFSMPWPELLFC